MSLEVTTLYRRCFCRTYPGLKMWLDRERPGWCHSDTETRMLTGRRRTDVQKLTDRLNAPIQGIGADGLKLALALLWDRSDECPGNMPVLVCHDEIVVECDAEQATDAKACLERAMTEGMDTVLTYAGEAHMPVEVESRIASSWGEG